MGFCRQFLERSFPVPVQGAIIFGTPPVAIDVDLGDRPRNSVINHMFDVVLFDPSDFWSDLVLTGPGPPAIAPVLNSDGAFQWDTTNSPLGLYTFDATVQNPFGADVGRLTVNLTGGLTQADPILPVNVEPGSFIFTFTSVPSGLWYDPPAVSSFVYTADDGTLFSSILDFPTGFSDLFTVSVGGNVLGQFGPGQSVDFVSLLGDGVTEFTVSGINPLVDAEDPAGFPLQIAFTTSTGSFSMRAIVPEPTNLAAMVLGSVHLIAGRRRIRTKGC